ncbi:hypothetical protein HYV85_05560 [Candidatus Woesearchaeota archaeon]|nr:hypothetical protein [Candidatus Woesearchaeota archaeon]
MGLFTTKPIEEKEHQEFKSLLKDKKVEVSPHALDHLSLQQRKVFKEDELISMAERETPRRAYLQANGRYSAYYRKEDGYRRLIFDIEMQKAVIITFIDVKELPRIKL